MAASASSCSMVRPLPLPPLKSEPAIELLADRAILPGLSLPHRATSDTIHLLDMMMSSDRVSE